ncbi:Uncharacterised protein [Mycobacteroides abscessus]|nr:Uncharacterised protein [Mycobacteroides abscessus]
MPSQKLVAIVSPVRCMRSVSPVEPGRSVKAAALKTPPVSTSFSIARPDGERSPTKVRPDRT